MGAEGELMIQASIRYPKARLTDKHGICVFLGGISPSTYDTWHARGLVPGPIPGTSRYDYKAHRAALDRSAGLHIHRAKPASALDEWEQSHAS